jgi:hypothetical protein
LEVSKYYSYFCSNSGINIEPKEKNDIMKKQISFFIFLFVLASFLHSCDPNNDNPSDPTTDPRDKFVGSWICNETSNQNGISTYNVTISLNPGNTSQIQLANFYQIGSGIKLYAVVANNNATVPEQTASGLSIKGSGNYNTSTNKINWTYYVNDGADLDTCTAVYSK